MLALCLLMTVFMDETVSKSNPIVSDLVKDCLALPNYDIDVLRHSKDLKSNNVGRYFIQLCQNSDLRIVNGRFGLDSALATCTDTSVIDYFAISCTLDMKVKSFNPLFSDVHNTIELHVHPSFLVCNSNDNNMNPDPHDNFVKCRFVWSNDKKNLTLYKN